MQKTLLEIIDTTNEPNILNNIIDMAKQNAGGKRKNAGRKKGEPTKAIGQRVPIRFHKQLVQIVKTELQKLLEL
jgi:hypothetical protein